ncbi:MAG: adenylosuccinate lyase, partial [Gaiellaceae bacterium]
MAAVWEERSKLRRWLQVELLAVEAWASLGVVPREDAEVIKANAAEVDPARVEEIEATTNHDVI